MKIENFDRAGTLITELKELKAFSGIESNGYITFGERGFNAGREIHKITPGNRTNSIPDLYKALCIIVKQRILDIKQELSKL